MEAERDARVLLRENVPPAPRATMGVGDPARWYVEARDEGTVLAALDWAERRALPVPSPSVRRRANMPIAK